MSHKAFNYWLFDPFWSDIEFLILLFLRCLSLKQIPNIGIFIGNITKNRFKKENSESATNL
jgi:hypothetical protein